MNRNFIVYRTFFLLGTVSIVIGFFHQFCCTIISMQSYLNILSMSSDIYLDLANWIKLKVVPGLFFIIFFHMLSVLPIQLMRYDVLKCSLFLLIFFIVVLELCEKYQKRFGPLRYFVAGFLRFLFLPKYSFELEYLPIPKEEPDEGKALNEKEKFDMQDLRTDIVQRSNREGIPRASSLSSIDSIMTPSRMSPGDLDTTRSMLVSAESFEYVCGLDPNSKHFSSGRSNLTTKPEEVLHPQSQLPPRISSKSWADKGWTGLNETNVSRCSRADTANNDKEDISSTLSDPGPIWDSEPKWDTEPNWNTEPNWEVENPIHLPEPTADIEQGITKELVPRLEEKWVVKKGHFLGVLVCNHSCKTVQSLSSQVVAPTAKHDDNSLDLLLVRERGRLRLLRFFICLQFGRHLSLPYVEYIKVWLVML